MKCTVWQIKIQQNLFCFDQIKCLWNVFLFEPLVVEKVDTDFVMLVWVDLTFQYLESVCFYADVKHLEMLLSMKSAVKTTWFEECVCVEYSLFDISIIISTITTWAACLDSSVMMVQVTGARNCGSVAAVLVFKMFSGFCVFALNVLLLMKMWTYHNRHAWLQPAGEALLNTPPLCHRGGILHV